MPLVRQQDVLTVLPGTLPVPELAHRLADTQGAAIMKLGRTFPAVREALRQAGRLEEALYVERASTHGQALIPVKDVDPATVPYFSIIIVPGDGRDRAASAERATGSAADLSGWDPGRTSGSPPRWRRRWPVSTTSSATPPT
jgi:precorrin-2 C20-methyltransferase/precorrin-3B C17-methyltransferase